MLELCSEGLVAEPKGIGKLGPPVRRATAALQEVPDKHGASAGVGGDERLPRGNREIEIVCHEGPLVLTSALGTRPECGDRASQPVQDGAGAALDRPECLVGALLGILRVVAIRW